MLLLSAFALPASFLMTPPATRAQLLVRSSHTALRTSSVCACAAADDPLDTADNPLAGPWWDGFCEEVQAEAELLGLEVRELKFSNGKLSVQASGAGVDELQSLNKHLSGYIDASADEEIDALPPFLLEVSSPGLSPSLTSDVDFEAFKTFPVTARTSEPFKKKTVFEGTLAGRDDEFVILNLKGRLVKIPRDIVTEVRLPDAKREAGDPY